MKQKAEEGPMSRAKDGALCPGKWHVGDKRELCGA